MCNISTLITITPYITLIGGAVFGAVGAYLVGTRLAERKEFKDACFAFQESFTIELATLQHPDSINPIDPGELLKAAFPQHRAAFIKFYCRLPSKKQEGFVQAWYTYYAYDDIQKDNAEYLCKYSPGWGQQPVRECRTLAITNIKKLLEFAEHK